MLPSNETIWSRESLIPRLMLTWYVALFAAMAVAPFDAKIWWSANILPMAFVGTLVATYRRFPLSNTSYILISVWLTLHTIAVHSTCVQICSGVPANG